MPPLPECNCRMHRLQVLAVALALLSLHAAQGWPLPGSSASTFAGRSLLLQPLPPVNLQPGQGGLGMFVSVMLAPQHLVQDLVLEPASSSAEFVDSLNAALDWAFRYGILLQLRQGFEISDEAVEELNTAAAAYVDATLQPIAENLATLEAETDRLLARATTSSNVTEALLHVVSTTKDSEFQEQLFSLWSGAINATVMEVQNAAFVEFLGTFYDILVEDMDEEPAMAREDFIETAGRETSSLLKFFHEYTDLESLQQDLEDLNEMGAFGPGQLAIYARK